MTKKIIDKAKLIEGLTLSDDDRAAMERILGTQENLETFSRRYLRREEGSRLTDQVTVAQREADQKMEQATAYAQQLVEWEQDNKPKLDAYQRYIQSLGIPEERVLAGVGAVTPPPAQGTPPPVTQPAFDASALNKQFVSRDEIAKAANELVDIPFQLHNISTRHRELYGVEPPADKMLAMRQQYLSTGKPLQDLAADAFHFSERQQVLDTERMEKKAQDMAEERFQKLISERGLPAASVQQMESPLFSPEFAQTTQMPNSNTQQDTAQQHFAQTMAELAQQGVRPSY